MAVPRQEIRGTFNREYHRFDDDTIIAALTDGTRLKGKAEESELINGITYRFYGTWGEYRGEKQFHFKQFIKAEPHTVHGLVCYLRHTAPHVGPAIAQKLFDAFGQDAVKVLRTDPARAAAAANGLTLERAQEAAAALATQWHTEETKIDLMDLFAERGFPHRLVNEVVSKWGVHSPARIRRDPFSLLVEGFSGCGFARCDRLYCDLGLPLDSLKRQMICLWYSMQEQSNGHTWHFFDTIAAKMKRMVSGNVRPEKAVELGVRSRWLKIRDDGKRKKWIAVAEQAENEADLADCVARLQGWIGPDEVSLSWPSADTLTECTEHQRDTASKALRSPVAILTGGPGTGKTFTVSAITRQIKSTHGFGSVAIAAPTGKAAVRCTAAFSRLGVPLEATTIHRLLGVQRAGHDGKGWGFRHNEGNPLKCKFLIIDEASMLDTDLCASIFRALQMGTHVLLVGDPYQLPPVGHGAPLRDMLESPKVPSGELTKIERNSGDIIRVCQDIRSGRGYRPSSGVVDIPAGRNVRHWETHDAIHSMGVLHDLLCSPPKGIDPVWDIQILCAVNEKSELGRKYLNKTLQDLFNPTGDRVPGCQFRVNDKVICTSNSALPLLEGNGDEVPQESLDSEIRVYVANGEIGKVVKIANNLMAVEFDTPRRVVRVPMNAGDCDFDLGYAITVHKAQGSQSPVIITMIDDSGAANQVCNREWHMTAMSRPEKLLLTIGKRHVVDKQCRKVGLRDRKTFLKELLEVEQ